MRVILTNRKRADKMVDMKGNLERGRNFRFKPISPYWFVAGVILALAGIELPYRTINIPQEVLIPLGLFTLIAIVYIALENHDLILLILVSYLPFSKVLAGDFGGFMTGFNLTNILGGVVIVGWLAKRSIREESFYKYSPADVPMFLYCFLVTLSIVRGGISNDHEMMGVLLQAKRYLTPFIFFFVFSSNINDEEHIHKILVTMCIATAMAGVMGLKEFYMDIGSRSSIDNMRIEGITEQPNNLGAFFTYYTYIMVAFLLVHMRNYYYWALGLPVFMCFWALVLTFSRGSMISFGAAGAFILWMKQRVLWVLLVVLILLMILAPGLFPESVIGRFSGTNININKPDTMEESAKVRWAIWKFTVNDMRNHFWLGLGYGRFIPTYKYADAHNGFILIASEMGVPALMLWLIIVGVLFWQALWLFMNSKSKTFQVLGLSFMTAIVGVMVSNLFGSRLHSQELSSYFWIMGGLTMAGVRMEKAKAPERGENAKVDFSKGFVAPETPKPKLVGGEDEEGGGTSVPNLPRW